MGNGDRWLVSDLFTVKGGAQAEVASTRNKRCRMLATFGYFAWLSAYCFNTERYLPSLPPLTELQNPGTVTTLNLTL